MGPAAAPSTQQPGWLTPGLLALQGLLSAWLILHFDGTGDAGDSVMHYLFARHAPTHPALFLDHWAKPLFVLLASPFAQFGFAGMKAFNALCALGSTWLSLRVAARLGFRFPWTVAVLLMAMPAHIALTFSGLTEPLFALLLIASLERAAHGRPVTAALLASWLPYVRSEGLIVIGVFGLYLLLERRWRQLPLLLTGSAVYALVGLFALGDPLWVFTKIPYARLASSYGSGEMTHFVEQLLYIVGVPIYALLWLGALAVGMRTVRGGSGRVEGLLILGTAVVYIAAHTAFWALGIFHSMGLKRVLIGIAPLLALVAARGLELVVFAWTSRWPKLRTGLLSVLLAYVALFPFTSNPAALNADLDLRLTNDQRLADRVGAWIRAHRPAHGVVMHAHPFVNMALDLDPFDTQQRTTFEALDAPLAPTALIVWENWFAVVEAGIPREQLDADPRLQLLFEERTADRGREVVYAVYAVSPADP